ncbi:unnamed protein product [Albugo candida]|uniref:Uncharacterized protein n=1 Tax=Albugo candida TaxID=65357 RepID=A0A024FZJ7_9STRA|nr:unnamed protein product [Albugo candida]|eukprot:CCI39906.1 unnamed protein product [Albugo candida]
MAKQQMKIMHFALPTPRGDVIQHINRKISYYALRKVSEQLEKARCPMAAGAKPCSSTYITKYF